MAAYNKYEAFVGALGLGAVNLDADVLKIALSNTTPDAAADAALADAAEIAAGGGYVAGGEVVANSAYAQAGGVGTLAGDDVVFTAAGGNIGPFRYVILYDATADVLIGWWDRGVAVTLVPPDTFTVDLDQVNGILTVT